MALQATGGTWASVLEPDLNPSAVRKGVITDILIGDKVVNGVGVDLTKTSAGLNSQNVFTPFAQDGTLRNDLLIGSNGGVNLGLFHIGLLKDDGWTFTPDVTVDKTPVAQSPWSVRNDITGKSGEIMFVAREWKPLLSYLQMELPTVDANGNSIVPDIGTAGYSLPAPGYQNICERWAIALGVDGGTMFAYTFPRISTKKLGKMAANKKDPLDREFSFETLLDPYTGSPYIESAGGPSWLGLGGAPHFPATPAPTATPVTGLKVTVTFPQPTGFDVQSLTYSISAPFTIPASGAGKPTVSNGIVSLTASGATASTAYNSVVITATGDNNATATLPVPSFTSTAS